MVCAGLAIGETRVDLKFEANGKIFELASQDRVEAVEHLAPRFFETVLGLDYWSCIITDETDLSDFLTLDSEPEDSTVEPFFEKIEEEYFRDLREVGSTLVIDLLEELSFSGISE